MLKVLCFSKDRPLQLHGYLESLSFCGQVYPEDISVIYAKSPHYKPLVEFFPRVNFIEEDQQFDKVFRDYINSLDDKDLIIPGCDDVVYYRMFPLYALSQAMLDPSLLGFSLRLGKNIKSSPVIGNNFPVITWEWAKAGSHWGYPFELMATLYRVSFIKELLKNCQIELKSPNYFESFGVNYCINNGVSKTHPYLAMFNTNNYCAAQDINRVQHDFPNKFGGTEDQSAEKLIEAYNSGKRLAWWNLWDIAPSDCFVQNNYFKLV